MTLIEKKLCDNKLDFLCSPMIKGIVISWCMGLNYKQKTYVLSTLLSQLCLSLDIKKEDIINEKSTIN
ncbi:MAG: hypothetical protein QME49_01635 [bacterium]|nr:hypothetical protein [bacterium]